MNDVVIYQHLGLGDHIICNALVRHYANVYEKIFLICKKHNYESVKFMYRDKLNIEIVFDMLNKNTIQIGFTNEYWNKKESRRFDEQFYYTHNIEFNKRWDNFFVKRDLKREIDLYNKMMLNNKNYIFIHDDCSRDMKIDESLIDKNNCDIFKPDFSISNNIFDYLHIIEKAKEVHVIDSSFMFMIDSYDQINNNLFVHRYARKLDNFNLPTLKKEWKIL